MTASESVGSSPRVRGAASRAGGEAGGRGIIPARAGSRSPSRGAPTWSTDHPRACGEQCTQWKSLLSRPGSSPRVRGADDVACHDSGRERIIPARAGSSAQGLRGGHDVEDHPRACGEQASCALLSLLDGGSSPRVRGAASQAAPTSTEHRIIPARAGSSSAACSSHPSSSDHPRACGEQ